jgi:ribonuclease BN (tRNA processing enzyme)
MELTVVGSGTVVPHGEQVCACLYLETRHVRLLLDCGPGATHHMARFGVPWQRLTHVAVTHFHNDHFGDLPILLFALKHGVREPRREPLVILGPAGIEDRMERLAAAFGDHLRDPGFPLEVHALGPDDAVGGLALHTHPTPHTDESLAFRIEQEGRSLGYTGDTGPSAALGAFFHGVDLLVAECSVPDEQAMPTHLTPASVAGLARAAQPGELLLTHIHPQLDRAVLPSLVRQAGWDGRLRVAQDGARLVVGAP